jgi:large subunit ribosomal protein L13
MATQIAILLMGKNKPIYTRGNDCGDHVVVTNAKEVALTGRKREQKYYFSHSGYPGGSKFRPFERVIEQNPAEVIIHAVKGMLPKNKLRQFRLDRLKVFPDEANPYAQNIVKDMINEVPEICTKIRDPEAMPKKPSYI